MGRVRQKKNEAASPFSASPKVLCAPRRFVLQACRRFSEVLHNGPGYRSPHYIGIEGILAKTPCCSPFRDFQMSWEIFQCISFVELLSQCSVQFVATKTQRFCLKTHRNVVVIYFGKLEQMWLLNHIEIADSKVALSKLVTMYLTELIELRPFSHGYISTMFHCRKDDLSSTITNQNVFYSP